MTEQELDRKVYDMVRAERKAAEREKLLYWIKPNLFFKYAFGIIAVLYVCYMSYKNINGMEFFLGTIAILVPPIVAYLDIVFKDPTIYREFDYRQTLLLMAASLVVAILSLVPLFFYGMAAKELDSNSFAAHALYFVAEIMQIIIAYYGWAYFFSYKQEKNFYDKLLSPEHLQELRENILNKMETEKAEQEEKETEAYKQAAYERTEAARQEAYERHAERMRTDPEYRRQQQEAAAKQAQETEDRKRPKVSMWEQKEREERFRASKEAADRACREANKQFSASFTDDPTAKCGEFGETEVNFILSWFVKRHPEYKLITPLSPSKFVDGQKCIRIYAPNINDEGQIDHILVGPIGVIHIETKCISADFKVDKDGIWHERRVNTGWMPTDNFAQQAMRHDTVIQSVLPGVKTYPMIVLAHKAHNLFQRENSKVPAAQITILDSDLEELIQNQPAMYSEAVVDSIVKTINESQRRS